MALANYADLQTSVASWLHRGNLTAMIPDFINLAEAKINREVRIRAMEQVATGTVAASVALPTGFVEMIALTVSTGNKTWPLTYVPPAELNTESSAPYRYSIVGDNLLFATIGTGYTYSLTYYEKFDALSTGVNWLITNAPDIYLYATLLEAAPYIKDDPRIATWAQLLLDSVERLARADKRDRFGSNLVVRAA